MNLVEDKIEIIETGLPDPSLAMQHWQNFPHSTIWHHNEQCCRIAREWMLSIDYSQLNAGNTLAGPRWLRSKFAWGPSQWPLYWCEAAEQKTLDCGALAALAHELFVGRGVVSFPVQLIQRYTEDATRQWHKKWNGDETIVNWIKEDFIYHEGCAVMLRDDEIKIWDATASWWVNPKQFGGYGGLLALRVFTPQMQTRRTLKWGKHRIVSNQWQKIEKATSDFIAREITSSPEMALAAVS